MSARPPSRPREAAQPGSRRPVCRVLRSAGAASWAGADRPRPRSLRSYSVDASEVADLHVISYEVERDLMPLILANCQYQVAQGGESLQELDLERIQRQLAGRFLQGKPRLSLRGLPTLVYRRDWNYEHLFAAIRSRMPQVSPPAAAPSPGSPRTGLPRSYLCAHAEGQRSVCGMCVLSMYACVCM